MNKCSFYTLIKENKKIQAKLVNGYSDGCYYYYKSVSGLWYAIHPLIGLCIATGYNRKTAQENANTISVTEGLERLYNDKNRYRILGNEFEKYIDILKQENKNKNQV